MTSAQSHSDAYILPLARLKAGGNNPHSAPVWEEVPWVVAMPKDAALWSQLHVWKDGWDLMEHGAMAWLKLGLNWTSGLSFPSFPFFFFSLSRSRAQALRAEEALSQKLDKEIPLGFNLTVNICNSLWLLWGRQWRHRTSVVKKLDNSKYVSAHRQLQG